VNRGASAAVQAEWAKAANAPAHLVECAFDAGEGGTVYLTDSYRVVVYSGNTYGAGGHLLGFSGLAESSELRIRELTLSLSGVDQTWVSIVLAKTYIGRPLRIRRMFYDQATELLMVDPVLLFDGQMEEPKVDDDPNGKTVVSIVARDQFADFERRTGRHTNANDQNMWFPNDRAFDLFPQLAIASRTFMWGGHALTGLGYALTNALNQAAGTPFGRTAERMRFAVEPFSAWYRDAIPLFYAHWKLLGRHQERFRLAPDWARWLDAEKKGLLFCATARSGWALSGYAIFLVTRHWDYPDILEARQRVLYIDPEQLTGMKAIRFARFVSFCDRELATRGVNKITHHGKESHDFRRVLARLGYERGDWEMTKVL
jgi:hypothetical protein